MHSDWAAENLQVIRTLMERSAVYRRALAPMTFLAGGLGIAAAVAGELLKIQAPRAFIGFWLGVAVVVMLGVAFLVRRQALQAREPFWSLPARRVARAVVPAGTVGLVITAGALASGGELLGGSAADPAAPIALLSATWILLYGLGLNAAGFFMPRGIQLFGWLLLVGGGASFIGVCTGGSRVLISAHWLMGFHFGLLHLAYGCYLSITEKPVSRL